jgi:hypothetical protein
MQFSRSGRVGVGGLLALASVLLVGLSTQAVQAQTGDGFRTDFNFEECDFSSEGSNRYFILEPGYQLVLSGRVDRERVELTITVLDETRRINVPGIGSVVTRVVEERETADGELVEVSRNYFAICDQTKDVGYFGEEVDIYENGKIVSHEGAWLAGRDGAKPGVIMPGAIVVGDKYYQEIAPGVALDRAENISVDEVVRTPAGRFTNVLKVKETTPLEPGDVAFKFYAPDVGLIQDGELKLVSSGQSGGDGSNNDGGTPEGGEDDAEDDDDDDDDDDGPGDD